VKSVNLLEVSGVNYNHAPNTVLVEAVFAYTDIRNGEYDIIKTDSFAMYAGEKCYFVNIEKGEDVVDNRVYEALIEIKRPNTYLCVDTIRNIIKERLFCRRKHGAILVYNVREI